MYLRSGYFAVFISPQDVWGTQIIQTDHGREFVNKLMDQLVTFFPNMQFIHGRPRHSQSQGSVEAAIKTVQNRLFAMVKETGRKDCSNLVDAVQHAMNTTVHSATRKTPYELVFDRQAWPQTFPGVDASRLVWEETELEALIEAEEDNGKYSAYIIPLPGLTVLGAC